LFLPFPAKAFGIRLKAGCHLSPFAIESLLLFPQPSWVFPSYINHFKAFFCLYIQDSFVVLSRSKTLSFFRRAQALSRGASSFGGALPEIGSLLLSGKLEIFSRGKKPLSLSKKTFLFPLSVHRPKQFFLLRWKRDFPRNLQRPLFFPNVWSIITSRVFI